MRLGELGVRVEGRRRGVVGTTPCHELFLTVLVLRLGLVQALKGTVVALVEAPVADDGDPVPVSGVKGDVGRVDGTTLQGCVDHVREDVVLAQQLTTATGFGATLVGQVDVHPPGELVRGVPLALAVAEQN